MPERIRLLGRRLLRPSRVADVKKLDEAVQVVLVAIQLIAGLISRAVAAALAMSDVCDGVGVEAA